jgi:quinol monooxygenase YgiN
MSKPCVVIASFSPKPEHYEDVKRVLLEVLPDVHQEPGCELYALHEDVNGGLVLIEQWTTRELWQSHLTLETVARIKKGLEGLLEKDTVVQEMYGVNEQPGYPGSL